MLVNHLQEHRLIWSGPKHQRGVRRQRRRGRWEARPRWHRALTVFDYARSVYSDASRLPRRSHVVVYKRRLGTSTLRTTVAGKLCRLFIEDHGAGHNAKRAS